MSIAGTPSAGAYYIHASDRHAAELPENRSSLHDAAKGFSIINLSGLTIGITCTLLIVLFIRDELSYDNFHRDSARIYRLGLLSAIFSGLVIFIACLGLFGLAAFTAELRTKEIGIRKVMGASVNEIVVMINKDFLKPVIFANIVAWPLAGWLMYLWIRQFAYHISFPWWVFVLATLLSLVIAFVSVSLQTRKAAMGNPVTSLRNE